MEKPLGKAHGVGGKSEQSPSRIDTLPDGFSAQLAKAGPRIGDVVGGRYRLQNLIGDGAMGQVFVAENTAIHVEVAVKVLRPDLMSNPEFRRRFQVEALAIAAVDHPNVARFVDLVIGDPSFLVMEYVRGRTLADVLHRERKLKAERAVRLVARLCWGLDAAHAAGIVHRDLKPGNIMLTTSREHRETPKIIDFGLAKLAHIVEAPLTRSGQIVGTPEYMAPEQIAGKDVDARTDIYALGCVLYAMLVGHSPFHGADDDMQTLYRQIHDEPTRASSLVSGVIEELDAVLAKALAKAPAARFQDMQEMAHALEATLAELEDEQTARTTATTATRARSRATPTGARTALQRAPRWALAAGLAAAALLAFGGGALLGRGSRESSAASGAAGAGLLVIATTPPGATVELDGHVLAETTPTAMRELAAGRHVVKLRHPAHQEVVREVVVGAGAERVALQIVLPARSRSVALKTIPSGARVFLDDNLVGATTPTTFTVQEDEFYQLRVEKAGFQPITRNIGPDDQEPELSLTMEVDREPIGAVMVESPAKAQVWIDGVATGYTTPTVAIRMPAGEHTVQIRDSAGTRSAVTRVVMKAGVTERVQLNLDTCNK